MKFEEIKPVLDQAIKVMCDHAPFGIYLMEKIYQEFLGKIREEEVGQETKPTESDLVRYPLPIENLKLKFFPFDPQKYRAVLEAGRYTKWSHEGSFMIHKLNEMAQFLVSHLSAMAIDKNSPLKSVLDVLVITTFGISEENILQSKKYNISLPKAFDDKLAYKTIISINNKIIDYLYEGYFILIIIALIDYMRFLELIHQVKRGEVTDVQFAYDFLWSETPYAYYGDKLKKIHNFQEIINYIKERYGFCDKLFSTIKQYIRDTAHYMTSKLIKIKGSPLKIAENIQQLSHKNININEYEESLIGALSGDHENEFIKEWDNNWLYDNKEDDDINKDLDKNYHKDIENNDKGDEKDVTFKSYYMEIISNVVDKMDNWLLPKY